MIKVIFLIFILNAAWANDPMEYARLYSKISTAIYDIETEVQELTNKNIYIELEKFSVEDGRKQQFKVGVTGSYSFDFQAQFLLTDITEENIKKQLEILKEMILNEVNEQIKLRSIDAEILKDITTTSSQKALGLNITENYTVLWVQLPAIENENHHWLRTTISSGAANYLDCNPLAGQLGIETTIWSYTTEYASDLDKIKNKIVTIQLGTLKGVLQASNDEISTRLSVELGSFHYSEAIEINDTLKFFYQGAVSLGLEYLIKVNEYHSYLPFNTSVEIGLILSDTIVIKLGAEADLAILSDWGFMKKDNALITSLVIELILNNGTSLFFGASYNFVGENYHGTKNSGPRFSIGVRIKL